jgi:undecaprenyl-diphosphatase
MDFVLVALLGAIQGLTEFLPISSDGHLAIAEALVEAATDRHIPDALGLNIVLHAGTLLAIVLFYWRRLLRLFSQDRRVIGLLIVGTLPAVMVGLPLHRWGGEVLTNPLLAGAMLPLTGLILLWGVRHPPGDIPYQNLTWRQALVIGLFQAVAILPGISRSGSTIAAALALGVRRDAAATFSFLLAVPAVGGACLLELRELLAEGSASLPIEQLAVGAVVSLVVGLLSLWWLIRWLQQGRLHYFAWWCIAVGMLVLTWQLAALPAPS